MDELIFVPPAGPPGDDLVRLACLTYAGWDPAWLARARELAAARAPADIYTASAAGDAEAVRDLLARAPELARTRGGPFRWEPLLYACYSRLDGPPPLSTLEVARVLLAAGADPDAGFLWRGEVPPFTALTGAFGNGEDGTNEPPHPRAGELAKLLLDAGADPNDGQALYNCHFRRGNRHLELLLAFGLGRDKGGPWYARLGDRLQRPARLLVEELWSAARKGFPERVELLAAHGVDLDAAGLRDGRTAYQAALRNGHDDIAAALVRLGARPVELDPDDRFAAACINGRRDEALAMIAAEPGLVARIGPHRRVELLHRAVEVNRPAGLRLMAELGFELSGATTHDNVGLLLAATPMHNAAWLGRLELVQLLVELGADPTVREQTHGATPLGWAAHNRQQHVVDWLRAQGVET